MYKIPSAQQIKAMRIKYGCTQAEAAAYCGITTRAWQLWEAGDRKIPWAAWQIFLIRTDQHPIYGIKENIHP